MNIVSRILTESLFDFYNFNNPQRFAGDKDAQNLAGPGSRSSESLFVLDCRSALAKHLSRLHAPKNTFDISIFCSILTKLSTSPKNFSLYWTCEPGYSTSWAAQTTTDSRVMVILLNLTKFEMSFSFPMSEPLPMFSVAFSPANQDGRPSRITILSVLLTSPETLSIGVP